MTKLAIGYDYGTTTSMIQRYDALQGSGVNRRVCQMASMCSSVLINDEGDLEFNLDLYKPLSGNYIRSPKRHLSSGDYTSFKERHGVSPSDIVQGLTEKIFENLDFNQDEIFITVSVPNAFRNFECRLIYNAVSRALDAIKPLASNSKINLDIIPEPVAAAMYYLCTMPISNNNIDSGYAIVCDIGGGTTDLTIVRYTREVIDHSKGTFNLKFEVFDSQADDRFGGIDIDQDIKRFVETKLHLDSDYPEYSQERLLVDSELLKISLLSSKREVKRPITIYDQQQKPIKNSNGGDLSTMCITANILDVIEERGYCERLEEMLGRLAQRLDGAEDRERLCLLPVGGSAQIAKFQEVMKRVFQAEIYRLPGDINPCFDCVSQGSAYYSAWRMGELNDIAEVNISNRTPHRIAIKCLDELKSCVEKNMPDGDYQTSVYANHKDSNGRFSLGRIEFHEIAATDIDQAGQASYIGYIDLPNDLYCHGCNLRDIEIELHININNSRIQDVVIFVPKGNSDKTDFTLTTHVVKIDN